MINQNIFREYDIRGIYPTELNEETAYLIGQGFGTHIKSLNEEITIVGHDNRLSSDSLYDKLIQGITSTGINVVSLGLVTTPMYYYARIYYKFNTGIMLTASHNPTQYNGFKIAYIPNINAHGKDIFDLRDLINEKAFIKGTGYVIERNIKEEYIKLIQNSLDIKKRLKIVVDCGNGTGSIIIKDILDKLNVEYCLLYCDSDGHFPNHHPDPSLEENLIDLSNKVRELNYDFGIGIDGDGDRVGLVDNEGKFIKADTYMLIMYRYLYNNLKNKKALFDVKCSRSLLDELDRLGIEKVMNRTGNPYAAEMMFKGDFDFGGEYSGHIFFRDKYRGFDDGIYAGLRMLELLSNKDTKLSDELLNINKYYSTEEIKVNTDDVKKFEIVEKVKEYSINKNYNIILIDGVRVEFKDSWCLVRVSNTTPTLTLRFEAKTNERLIEIKNEFVNLINSLL